MKWPKDRQKAFLCVAEAFGTPYERRTKKQKLLTSHGICFAVEELTDSDRIYTWASGFRHGCGIQTLFWWQLGGIQDKERSLFCYLMAALSDKEFEELQA